MRRAPRTPHNAPQSCPSHAPDRSLTRMRPSKKAFSKGTGARALGGMVSGAPSVQLRTTTGKFGRWRDSWRDGVALGAASRGAGGLLGWRVRRRRRRWPTRCLPFRRRDICVGVSGQLVVAAIISRIPDAHRSQAPKNKNKQKKKYHRFLGRVMSAGKALVAIFFCGSKRGCRRALVAS